MTSQGKLHPQENYRLGKQLTARFSRFGAALAVLGLGGIVVSMIQLGFGASAIRRFFFSYTLAFTYVLSFAIGALFFVILHHLVKARWSVVIRRLAEAMMTTLWVLFPFALVIAVAVLAGYDQLYLWTTPIEDLKQGVNLGGQMSANSIEVLEHAMHAKSAYLNPVFFFIRIVIYFAVWIGVSRFMWKNSTQQDEDGDEEHTHKMRRAAPVAMILFAITTAFCSYDLLMSLEPAWFSTMFGVYFFAGCAISVMALLALLGLALRVAGRLRHSVTVEHYHDVGKLMFAFLFFWGYVAFSQFMLIWYANIPEETIFFSHRWHTDWKWVSIGLIVGGFAMPFVLLMSRHSKRTLFVLAGFAVWMLLTHWVDLYWLVMPNFDLDLHKWVLHPMDIACTALMVGVFVSATTKALSKHALLPLKDPDLGDSLKFENI